MLLKTHSNNNSQNGSIPENIAKTPKRNDKHAKTLKKKKTHRIISLHIQTDSQHNVENTFSVIKNNP